MQAVKVNVPTMHSNAEEVVVSSSYYRNAVGF